MRAEDWGPSDQGSWRIICAGSAPSAAPLLAETFDLADEIAVKGAFTVPASCPVQMAVVSADTTVRTGYVKLILAEAVLTGGR